MNKYILVIRRTILLLLIISVTNVNAQLSIGVDAPAFTLNDINGNTVNLSDYSGKIVVLNFFGNDCPYCKDAAPYLESDIWQVYKDQDVVVLGIDQWNGSANVVNSKFIGPTNVTYPVLLNGSSTAQNYQVTYDKYYILNRDHKIFYYKNGTKTGSGSPQSVIQDVKSQVEELLTLTSIEYDNIVIAKEFSLNQNYPNPFNPETRISFNILKSENVSLLIYNLLGKNVRTLVNKKFSAGLHNIVWDSKDNYGNNVSSGVYFYRLKTKSKTLIKKMMLIR